MLYTMVNGILYKGAIMGFLSNASHRPRALVCTTTSMQKSVGPIFLIGLWFEKLFDKSFTGQ